MRTWVVLIFLLSVACSASRKQSRALQRADKAKAEWLAQLERAAQLGAIVDTTTKILIHDTVRYHGVAVTDSVVIHQVDTVLIKEVCQEIRIPGGIERLRHVVCPAVDVDTIYQTTMEYQGVKYPLPIHLSIKGNKDSFTWRVKAGEVLIPVVKQENTMQISPEIPKRKFRWYEYFIAACALCMAMATGFILGRIFR